jgi:hypothetical protein
MEGLVKGTTLVRFFGVSGILSLMRRFGDARSVLSYGKGSGGAIFGPLLPWRPAEVSVAEGIASTGLILSVGWPSIWPSRLSVSLSMSIGVVVVTLSVLSIPSILVSCPVSRSIPLSTR